MFNISLMNRRTVGNSTNYLDSPPANEMNQDQERLPSTHEEMSPSNRRRKIVLQHSATTDDRTTENAHKAWFRLVADENQIVPKIDTPPALPKAAANKELHRLLVQTKGLHRLSWPALGRSDDRQRDEEALDESKKC
jgi:hypothetical protein